MAQANIDGRSADRAEGARSTTLTIEEEAVVVAFRRHTLLPLDDCLYALHPQDFITAYNFARRLKTLRGLTPYEFICKAWGNQPHRFTSNPHHQLPGPNI